MRGGREGRPIGAYELAQAVEALGAGEILLNCIDEDGQGDGFDTDLVSLPKTASTSSRFFLFFHFVCSFFSRSLYFFFQFFFLCFSYLLFVSFLHASGIVNCRLSHPSWLVKVDY